MVKIEAIRLVNCQSWKDDTLQLSEGLNILKAENQTGKSVVMKVLKATVNPKYYTSEELALIIRTGALFAEVTYLFTDNTVAIVRIYNNCIMYYFAEDAKNPVYIQSTNIPPKEIISRLSAICDEESGFILNIMDADQDLFLVDSDSKSNSNLVKILTEDVELKQLIDNCSNKIEYYKDMHVKLERQLNNTKIVVDTLEYVDVDNLIEKKNKLNVLLPALKCLNSCIGSLNIIIDNMTTGIDYEQLLNLINLSIVLDDFSNINTDTKGYTQEDLDLIDTAILLQDINETMQLIKPNEDVSDLNNLNLSIVDLLESLESINKVSYSISHEDLIGLIDTCFILDSIVEDLGSILTLFDEIENIEDEIEANKCLLNSLGDKLDCPVHGKITLHNGECIPVI